MGIGAQELPSGVVTFLLTDIEGSTRLWEEHADAMAVLLDEHDDAVDAAVARFGGTVLKAKGEGDSTFSVFQRASDAIAAAAEAQLALTALAVPGGEPLRVRMAVHTGEAVERAGDYFGRTVNRGARLRALARGGEVLVSHATAELTVDHLEEGLLVDIGEHSLRDLARPERVYRLSVGPGGDGTGLAAGVVDKPTLPDALASTAPFVGRAGERDRLMDAFRRAQSGDRQILLVGGEPGAGKTALVAAAARDAHGAGATVLLGRCDPDLGPYQAFAEALTDYARVTPAVRLAAEAAHGAGDLARVVPEFAARIPRRPPPVAGEPETERQAFVAAVSDLLLAAAEHRPIVLVLDDLQWASPFTVQLLRALVRDRRPARLLILGTYRDTEVTAGHPLASLVTDLHREGAGDRIPLSGLDVAEVVGYLEAMAGQDLADAGSALAEVLVAQTGGNPFFVTEIVRHLVETGLVYQQDGRWQSDVAASALPLPTSVVDVLSHRLAGLGRNTTEMLAVAAVAGAAFSPALAAKVLGRDVLDDLDAAIGAGVLVESGAGSHFAHALFRTVVDGGLSAPRRARLHRLVGEALASVPRPVTRIVAHHFLEGVADGGAAEAVEWALAASQEAMAGLDFEGAAVLVDRAAGVVAATPDLGARAEAEVAVARAYAASSGLADPRALGKLAVAAARAAGCDDLFVLAVAEYTGWSSPGYVDDEFPELVRRALDILEGDDPVLRASLLAAKAQYLLGAGGDVADGLALADEAVAAARASGSAPVIVMALGARAVAGTAVEPARDRCRILDEAVALVGPNPAGFSRTRGVVWAGPAVLRVRAATRYQAGDLDGFRQDLERHGLTLDRSPLTERALSASLVSMAAMAAGDFDESERVREAELAPLAGEGDWNVVTAYSAQFAILQRERGRLAELLPIVEAAAGEREAIVAFRALLAVLHAEVGDPDTALAIVEPLAIDNWSAVPRDSVFVATAALLAETVAASGRSDLAQSLVPLITPMRGDLVTTGWGIVCLGAVDRYVAMLLDVAGEPAADEVFAAAEAMERRLGLRPLAVRTGLWWARSRVRRGTLDRGVVAAIAAEATALGMPLVAAAANALA